MAITMPIKVKIASFVQPGSGEFPVGKDVDVGSWLLAVGKAGVGVAVARLAICK